MKFATYCSSPANASTLRLVPGPAAYSRSPRKTFFRVVSLSVTVMAWVSKQTPSHSTRVENCTFVRRRPSQAATSNVLSKTAAVRGDVLACRTASSM